MISTQSVSFYQLVVLRASDSSSLSPLSISPIVCWRGCHIVIGLSVPILSVTRLIVTGLSVHFVHLSPCVSISAQHTLAMSSLTMLWQGGDCLGLSCLLPSPCLSVCAVNRSAPNSPPSFPNWLQLGRIEDDVRGIPPPGRPLIQNTFTTSNIADL